MGDLFENLQYLATGTGFLAMLPEFYSVYSKKSIATNSLSTGTGALFVSESLLRLPNIGAGLFSAIKKKDSASIKQLSLASVGISIMCISFYILIVSQAVYNTTDTKEHADDKHISKILSVVFAICIICITIYYYRGIRRASGKK